MQDYVRTEAGECAAGRSRARTTPCTEMKRKQTPQMVWHLRLRRSFSRYEWHNNNNEQSDTTTHTQQHGRDRRAYLHSAQYMAEHTVSRPSAHFFPFFIQIINIAYINYALKLHMIFYWFIFPFSRSFRNDTNEESEPESERETEREEKTLRPISLNIIILITLDHNKGHNKN